MVACTGCKKTFANQHGLNRHRAVCNSVRNHAAQLLQHRHQLQKSIARTKHAARHAEGHQELTEVSPEPEPMEEDALEAGAAVERQPTPQFEPPPTAFGRRRKFPRRYEDFLPNTTTQLPHMPPKPMIAREPSPPASPSIHHVSPSPPPSDHHPSTITTDPDEFGLFRVYPSYPTALPDENLPLDDFCDAPGLSVGAQPAHGRWWTRFGRFKPDISAPRITNNVFAPFLNATVFQLMNWFYSSATKSIADLQALVDDVLLSPDFNLTDLKQFSAKQELRRMDGEIHTTESTSSPFANENGWQQSTIRIKLPAEKVHQREDDAPELEIPGVYHRSLCEVITSAFQDEAAKSFHYTPFSLFWKATPNSTPERIHSEIYNSDAFIEEHKKIMESPLPPGEQYERAVAAFMLGSDSTHLAQFGTAALWPIYAFFGNQSKYSRAKPSNFAAHHVAYLPTLPDTLQDTYISIFGDAATGPTLTHLKRELIHAIYKLLLDEEFMHAYEHGIVVKCADGITRRIFPRFFTYAADYPEKVLIATIRYLATCPCPQCFTMKTRAGALGTRVDDQRRSHSRVDTPSRQRKVETTRKCIFEQGRGVNSKAVNDILQEDSYTPTRNAFSTKLFHYGFNFFTMFVPDLLHDFELGVWKAIFTHLLRILYAAGDNCIQSLNWRYRHIPTFGRGTIRKFHTNASAMKKLAARDFEDLLQCSIPVFEGLLPKPHNDMVLDLLFILCLWHAYAKLRLHTSSTLQALADTTKALGAQIRLWVKKTCTAFDTRELPKEESARHRRKATAATRGKSGMASRGLTQRARGRSRNATSSRGRGKSTGANTSESSSSHQNRLRKLFNMCTYKLHALGHYVAAIARFGTTDNYSTQVSELEHRRVKRFYARTNKNWSFQRQITKHQRRERLLRKIQERLQKQKKNPPHEKPHTLPQPTTLQAPPSELIQSPSPSVPFEESDALPKTAPGDHHHISNSTRLKENIYRWVDTHQKNGDDAVKDFIPRLKDHILSRLHSCPYDGDQRTYSEAEHDAVQFVNHRLFRHKLLRVNYTTYDLRRQQDSINPTSHPDIMLLSPDPNDDHPYWYARVIGIFHVDITHIAPAQVPTEIQRMRINFLWVRWFQFDDSFEGGWQTRRLHRLEFMDARRPGAFGFLDPSVVIRGVHLIPGFAHDRTLEFLPLQNSVARMPLNEDKDWRFYYIGMFADRDLFMRFRGGGVGHKVTNSFTQLFESQGESGDASDGNDDDVFEHQPGDPEEVQEQEEEDYGYKIGSGSEGEDGGSDDEEMGPEDGEEPWEMGDLQAEGFDEL